MFVDIVGFTKLSEAMPPDALITLLNNVFSEIDDLTTNTRWRRSKPSVMPIWWWRGAPERRPDHAEAMAAMALDIKERFAKLSRAGPHALDFPHWDPLRPGGRRRDRQEEVFLRHVGRQRETPRRGWSRTASQVKSSFRPRARPAQRQFLCSSSVDWSSLRVKAKFSPIC